MICGMTAHRPFAASLLAGLLLSCGGGGGAGTASDFIASYCDAIAPCCAMAKLPTNGQQCRTLFGILGNGKYDPTAGEACLAGLRAGVSKPGFCSSGMEDPACDRIFAEPSDGTRKPGETCANDDECAPSSEGKVQCHRVSSGGAEIRKCQVQVTGKAGDQPCVGTVTGNGTSYVVGKATDVPARAFLCRTADGLHCDWDTTTCTAFKAIGEACDGSDECGESAFCDTSTRKCAALVPVGGMCSGGFISRGNCAQGAYCQEMSMTCAAQAGHDAACTDDDQCKSSDCVNGKCQGDVPANLGLALICGGT
jgi:hypothetical protein